jgi:hypothetical protein
MTTATHHPSCPARNGGLCAGCKPDRPANVTPSSWRFTCSAGETHFVTGPNPAALLAERGCGCEVAA